MQWLALEIVDLPTSVRIRYGPPNFLRTKMNKKIKEFKCTECKGDAYVGLSDFKEIKGGVIIKKEERLCLMCARKRGLRLLS